uniref:Uncharacterized protein LOC117348852 isoform X3 n=1 Tax=Geotrypetes seraphini TaxID=260995 RepID=A0A6P8P1A1_GEOSA|nr:uncharacterized protein LOC117348852 isoform X3 [Geotrypetes seraphini]
MQRGVEACTVRRKCSQRLMKSPDNKRQMKNLNGTKWTRPEELTPREQRFVETREDTEPVSRLGAAIAPGQTAQAPNSKLREVESFVSAGKNSFSTSKMSEADFLLEELGLLKMTDSTEMVDAVLKWLGENYPDVKIVDATTLQSWIQEKRDKLLLLDIRNKTEFDISHLQGGVIVDPEGDQLQELLKKSVQEASRNGYNSVTKNPLSTSCFQKRL